MGFSFVVTCAIMGAIIGALFTNPEWKNYIIKTSLTKAATMMMAFSLIYFGVWFLAAIFVYEESFFPVVYLFALSFLLYFLASIGYTCPLCDRNSLDIQGDKSGTWIDTTPKTKSGVDDRRFNKSGFTQMTLKCNNKKCDKDIFTAPKKHIFHILGD